MTDHRQCHLSLLRKLSFLHEVSSWSSYFKVSAIFFNFIVKSMLNFFCRWPWLCSGTRRTKRCRFWNETKAKGKKRKTWCRFCRGTRTTSSRYRSCLSFNSTLKVYNVQDVWPHYFHIMLSSAFYISDLVTKIKKIVIFIRPGCLKVS